MGLRPHRPRVLLSGWDLTRRPHLPRRAAMTVTTAPGTRTDTALSPAELLRRRWATEVRWAGVERSYAAEDVIALRGRVVEEHTLARRGAQRLWELLHTQDYVYALGALTGNQAVQMVKAGLKAIYL